MPRVRISTIPQECRLFDSRAARTSLSAHSVSPTKTGLGSLMSLQPRFAAGLDAHGGYGFAAEYDVERKVRETRLYSIAPISNNLVLAYLGQHVLGMPRSY